MNKVYVVYGSSGHETPKALISFEDEETAEEYANLAKIACGCYPYKVGNSNVSLHGHLYFHVEPMELYTHGYDRMDIRQEITLEIFGHGIPSVEKRIKVNASSLEDDAVEFFDKFSNTELIQNDRAYDGFKIKYYHTK